LVFEADVLVIGELGREVDNPKALTFVRGLTLSFNSSGRRGVDTLSIFVSLKLATRMGFGRLNCRSGVL
jgi:hypothetical protein